MHNTILYSLLMHSDMMTKVILGMLLGASVICWTIFLYKVLIISIKKKQIKSLNMHLSSIKSVDELQHISIQKIKTVPGHLIGRHLTSVTALLEKKGGVPVLLDAEIDLLQGALNQLVDEMVHEQEMFVPFISMSAAVAPLLGLLGTIWGLVHAFLAISERQQADIATIAPGIAEALITTFAGLLVAIPAVIMFHTIYSLIKDFEKQLIACADKIQWIVCTTFMHRS